MARNRIWELRKAAKLTQRELAERAGTSQQQIQRVEAGVVAVRLDLAKRISDAFQVKLSDAFPGFGGNTKGSRPKKGEVDDAELAIDLDPRIWTAKFFIFDGREFAFEVSSFDKRRLESTISSSDKTFVVFNSRDRIVAANQTKFAACQFLFDPPSTKFPNVEDNSYELHLHLVDTKKPLSFDLEPDTKTAEQDEQGFASQLQRFFIDLDGAEDDEIAGFDDADGERVYVRKSQLVLVEAPLECCEPSIFNKSMEGHDEDEGLGKQLSYKAGR